MTEEVGPHVRLDARPQKMAPTRVDVDRDAHQDDQDEDRRQAEQDAVEIARGQIVLEHVADEIGDAQREPRVQHRRGDVEDEEALVGPVVADETPEHRSPQEMT